MAKTSETITENIFRQFHGAGTFIEKSAIPKEFGFISKKGTDNNGYPDFFYDHTDALIVVEAKALSHSQAEDEVKYYMLNNNVVDNRNIIGIAVSGQHDDQIKVTYYYKNVESNDIEPFIVKDTLLTIPEIIQKFNKYVYGDHVTEEDLKLTLKNLNETFHEHNIRDTDRSLFFSGLLIALTNTNFRSTYRNTQPPDKLAVSTTKAVVLESYNLNKSIVEAIATQLSSKINNLSKEFSWQDKFSFIKNIDFPLYKYIDIIRTIEKKIFLPFSYDEKTDILGKAYKIFLSRAGKIDNKNIILTPDHIKELMVKLARVNLDDVVLDTCMGTGGFLMEAMEKMIGLAKDNDKIIEDIKDNRLIGFETDSVLFALACSNMFLHGDGRTNLLFRNSLLYTDSAIVNSNDKELFNYIKNKNVTKIIINPPYEKNLSIEFVKQAINYLQPNGKLIIIMPTPTLARNQQGLTKEILLNAKLDFVIAMPYKLFAEQKRSVNTSIFGFTKTKMDVDDEVLFADMDDDGFVSIQHKGRVDINNKWNDIENFYLDIINNKKEISDISEKRKIFDKNGELIVQGIQKLGSSKYKYVKFEDIFTVEKGTLQSSKSEEDGEYDFITASSDWLKHDQYTYDCEALVYAVQAAGSLGKSQYVNGKFIASNLTLVLKERDSKNYPLNLKFYNLYLETIRKRLVKDLADGTSKLTIGVDVLKDYYIEYIPINIQNDYVNKYVDSFHELELQLQKAKEELKNGLRNIL